MIIRPANQSDCLVIAELALIAGDGIPGYFWAQNQLPDQPLVEVGASNLLNENENFSFRNTEVIEVNDQVAGMLLAYRLPSYHENDENLDDFPEFVRPLVELEQCVPDSYYINMLACFENYRAQGLGTALMNRVDQRAIACDCNLISIEVFESNHGALNLYQKLGYKITDQRSMVASKYHPADQALLLTKDVDQA